jgi:hypothetical protein
MDDVLTEEPDAGSRAVGPAQGTYMLASQHEEVLVVAVTVALTTGRTTAALKVIGCSSLRGGWGELGNLKSLTYDSN